MLRKKWIAALRSGEYKQATSVLCGPGGYCCLGVLAEQAGMLGPEKDGYRRAIGGGTGSLPVGVVGNESQFWHMNDCERKTFAEIADYIEAHPEIDPVWPPEGE